MTKKKYSKECFECGKNIETKEDLFILGLDKPYINLPFHKSGCKNIVMRDPKKYLQEHEEKVFEWSKKRK